MKDLITIFDVLWIDSSGFLDDLTGRVVCCLHEMNFLKDIVIHDDNETVDEAEILNESAENNSSTSAGNILNTKIDEVNNIQCISCNNSGNNSDREKKIKDSNF